MRKLIASLSLLSLVTFASPAFAALMAYRNARGQEVKAELKNKTLVDEKGNKLSDGEWTWVKDGKSYKVTVKGGKLSDYDWKLLSGQEGGKATPAAGLPAGH